MVAEMLTFFTLIFWSIAGVKLLGDGQAIAFFLHLFVLASRNSWVLSLGGCRGVAREGARGARAPRNLADQLTLFKPGGPIMPLTLLPAPTDSKSYLHLYRWYVKSS